MNQPLVLVVDDEPDICELIEITLARMDIDAHAAGDLASAKRLLAQHHYNLCLTDMRLPDGNGIELVTYLAKKHPKLPVAVITAHGNMACAIDAMKSGAFDFVSKPVDLHILRKLVDTSLKISARCPPDRRTRDTILGDSEPVRKIRSTIAKLARSQAPVFISGESGTGKELAARAIHDKGPRAEHQFIAVNCGAVPDELMESEFFGHKKGSFTGALADKQGLFQAADGGTLFLDEIADLPLHMQVKLLRAIQERSIRPVGATKEIKIDTRIISATHKNLAELVKQEMFRQDLFYRVNVIELLLPPLRDRVSDIPMLANHFMRKIAHAFACERPTLATGAMQKLQAYDFPGNIRELENVLERSMTLVDGDIIEAEDIQLANQTQIIAPVVVQAVSNPIGEVDLSAGDSMEEHLVEMEKSMILKALEETRWNKTAAAKKLGITFRVLRYRLAKLGLDKPA